MKKVLFVLTSRDQLRDAGKETGFWMEEFASPFMNSLITDMMGQLLLQRADNLHRIPRAT